MPFQRKRSPLVLEEKDAKLLESIAASRTEPYSKVKRAKMLLAYARGESISSIARKEQTNRPMVERHRSKEFIEFLSMADTYYPSNWKLRIILDNHSSHISKETMSWLKLIFYSDPKKL